VLEQDRKIFEERRRYQDEMRKMLSSERFARMLLFERDFQMQVRDAVGRGRGTGQAIAEIRVMRVYLDHCATTPVSPAAVAGDAGIFYRDVRERLLRPQVRAGGPGGPRRLSRDDRLPGRGEAREVVFTSGGTEADNHAIKGAAQEALRNGRNRIVTTAAEHHAVLDTCAHLGLHGFDVALVPVDGTGMVSPDDVRRVIDGRTALVSVMHANNEIGTINPVAGIAAAAREAGVPFHTDRPCNPLGKSPSTRTTMVPTSSAYPPTSSTGRRGSGR